MRRLLVINPNTGQATTERLKEWLGGLLPAEVHFECITANFGAPYIACEASHAVAGHALLDAWATHLQSGTELPDGIVIACFGDPGLFALREVSACPVTGLAEASFMQAAVHGPFAIVTGGLRWKAMLQRLAVGLGYANLLTHIEIVEQDGAALLADRDMALRVLSKACDQAAASGAKSVILGGAGLAGYASALQSNRLLPLIDSVTAALDVYLQNRMPVSPTRTNRFHTPWHGLTGSMSKFKL
jgi:allantoin racemase